MRQCGDEATQRVRHIERMRRMTRMKRWMAPLMALAASFSATGADAPAKSLTNALIYGGTLDGLPPGGFKWSPSGDRFLFMKKPAADSPSLLYVYDLSSHRSTALTSGDE